MRVIGFGMVAAIALGVAGWALYESERLPETAVPVSWNHQRCARCGMLVGEPAFAAQFQTTDGGVHVFDDPGCLMLWAEDTEDTPHAVYFHHHLADRWIRREQVRFLPASPTPMEYGLGAVDDGEPGALDYAAALVQAHTRDTQRREPGASP